MTLSGKHEVIEKFSDVVGYVPRPVHMHMHMHICGWLLIKAGVVFWLTVKTYLPKRHGSMS